MAEAALRESDLLAFQIAMETGRPGSVMTSYNLLNGDYTSENDFLINRVLKRDWGYAGWVMSDWGGTHSTEKAALAGLDVQSGAMLDTAPYFGRPLQDAVAAGRVPQARIDDMVRRILRSLFAVGAIDAAPEQDRQPSMLSRTASWPARWRENGIVLLKNAGDCCRWNPTLGRILIVGAHADAGVVSGGGSSSVTPPGSLTCQGRTSWVSTSRRSTIHPRPSPRSGRSSPGRSHTRTASDLAAAAQSARDADS